MSIAQHEILNYIKIVNKTVTGNFLVTRRKKWGFKSLPYVSSSTNKTKNKKNEQTKCFTNLNGLMREKKKKRKQRKKKKKTIKKLIKTILETNKSTGYQKNNGNSSKY